MGSPVPFMGKRIFWPRTEQKMLTQGDKGFSFNVGEMIGSPSGFSGSRLRRRPTRLPIRAYPRIRGCAAPEREDPNQRSVEESGAPGKLAVPLAMRSRNARFDETS